MSLVNYFRTYMIRFTQNQQYILYYNTTIHCIGMWEICYDYFNAGGILKNNST